MIDNLKAGSEVNVVERDEFKVAWGIKEKSNRKDSDKNA